jgi:hypothetical protein
MTSETVMNTVAQEATKTHGYLRESYKTVAPDPDYWPPMWNKVVEQADTRIPVATAGMGYHPGETR